MRYLLYAFLFVSVLTLPWWVSVIVMCAALSYPFGGGVAVAGALVMDALYGTHLRELSGISFLYTILMTGAALGAVWVRAYVVDEV